MPRRKTCHVESLVQKCLCSIAKELSNNNSGNVQVTTKEKSASSHQSNFPPFDEWPFRLLEQIIKFLIENDLLNVCHRDLLVNKQTRRLYLTSVTGISAGDAAASFMETAMIRCPNLSDLLLTGVTTLQLNQLYQFLPLFKHLRVLNVAKTEFNNAGLQILGAHSSHLRKLYVSGCPVSDDGIEELCRGHSGLPNFIEKLSMADTKVTQKGVETALRRLPRLKILVHPLVMETLADMAQNGDSIQGRKYGLLQLDFSVIEDDPWLVHDYKPYETGVLNAAALLCPSVTHLNISEIKGLVDSDLLGLLALEKLTNLQISSYPYYDTDCIFTFDGGLAPFLKARGRSLQSLILERLTISVRLGMVVKYCPNLKVLSLDCDYSTSFWPEEDQQTACKRTKMDFVFKQLEELKFSGRMSREPPPLGELLSAVQPTLKTLVIRKCSSFDDQLLLRVFELFKTLEQLELHHCRLTKGGIERVLFNEENCLKMFNISVDCRDSVSSKDLALMRTEAKTNWDLEFRYRTEHFIVEMENN